MFISSTFTDTAQERNLLIADGSQFSVYFVSILAFKVARGYFLGTEVLFSKSSFGHVNLNRFF